MKTMMRLGWILTPTLLLASSPLWAQDTLGFKVRDRFDVPAADAKSVAIVAAADRFLSLLSEDQQKSLVYAFSDNAQRPKWSNLPVGMIQRNGLMRGELSDAQATALDSLLGEILSKAGMRNIALQMAADDAMGDGVGRIRYGRDLYYVAFIGQPSISQPWMLQFGGHHLALNVTVLGPDLSFSPMLTGGQPLHLESEGQNVYITQAETAAAQAFLDSLSDDQRAVAIIGDRPINLLLGPGAFGTSLAPEGIKAGDLSAQQKSLLLAVITARLDHINDDDFSAKMDTIRRELDDAHFAWWGPVGTLGSAYFRITAPSVVMEYSPQQMGGDPTDHAHNIYRDPQNDYGIAWIRSD
ncbi:DUF3500 domain-containing protein [Rhizobium bangladeshense]|nr:DUF3500 domain-containing protein [Rhizobium sp. NLR15a]MBY3617793.1 DUF3500 domain-containing protein [Rhizobium bangladeshense]